MEFPRLYSVADIAKMTNLTTRTIRNYLKGGRLKGYKVGAQWRFTEENIKDLFESKGVSESIEDAKNKLVLDYLGNTTTDAHASRMCTIFDLPCSSGEEVQELCARILPIVNALKEKGEVGFSFQHQVEYSRARFIVQGNPRLVQEIVGFLAEE